MSLDTMNNVFKLVFEMDLKLLSTISYMYLISSVFIILAVWWGMRWPYGRYVRSGWGFFINAKAAWFIQELPSLVIPVIFLFTDAPGFNKTPNVMFFLLFIIHYIHRVCIFPFLINGGKPTTLATFVIALVFCIVNGYLHSAFLLYHADYGRHWWTRSHIWIGTALFLSGMAINVHSDHILRNLRKPGETGYKIPTGGMFEYVSGANFFGEMLEWFGFAVATWCLPGAAFSIFTCWSIGPRAWHHHKYYLEKFDNYPKDRKALIPFLF